MKVRVNGEIRELPEGLSVIKMLAHLEVQATRVAVERNRAIVPRARYAQTAIQEGDELEIVTFVGGG